MPEFSTFDQLPRHLGALTAGFRRSAAALVRSAAPGLLEAGLVPPMVMMRTATIQTRFSVTCEENEDILYFFHQGTGKRVVLDVSIRFRIAPAVFPTPPLRMVPEDMAQDLPAAATTPAIQRILHQMCEGWCEAYNAAAEASFETDSPLEPFLPDFEVQDYEGALLLRPTPEDSVAPRITVRIFVEGGLPRARISLGPGVLDC